MNTPKALFIVRTVILLSCVGLAYEETFAQDSLQKYVQQCKQAIGINVPDFNCNDNDKFTEVPVDNLTGEGKEGICDRPNVLNNECDEGSRFWVIRDPNKPDAFAVAHCRKRGSPRNLFSDIAVIQHNQTNGATCFYQALSPDQTFGHGDLRGEEVKAPSKGLPAWQWLSPDATARIRCVGCHDNGPIIRSPYLSQIRGKNQLPGAMDRLFNRDQPYFFIGDEFASWKAYKVEVPGNTCNGCHRMGVSHFFSDKRGTALDFGIRATARSQANKNPHSHASPIWMINVDTLNPMETGEGFDDPCSDPASLVCPQANLAAAEAIRDCADDFRGNPLNTPDCRITQYASGSIPDNAGECVDNSDCQGGGRTCESVTGTCTAGTFPALSVLGLIDAINKANRTAVEDTIVLQSDTLYTLSQPVTPVDPNIGPNIGPNGLPSIVRPLKIIVAGKGGAIIERKRGANVPEFRIFHNASGPLSLNDVTIRGGRVTVDTGGLSAMGGGILSSGNLTLTNCTVSDNEAFRAGGGIENAGRTTTLTNSTVRGNRTSGFGGGINSAAGGPSPAVLVLTNSTVGGIISEDSNFAGLDGGGVEIGEGISVINKSTISANRAGRFGGGIANFGSGTSLTLTNSTISGNTASGQLGASGGGITNFGGARLSSFNVTITQNTAAEGPGFFNEEASTVEMRNTLIAQNTDNKDCAGEFHSRGFNLIGNSTGCEVTVDNNAGTDLLGTIDSPINAQLDPILQEHGGLIGTHALLSDSPAIDKGGFCEPLDQRGFGRRDGPDANTIATCDIGAFEFGGPDIVNRSFAEPPLSIMPFDPDTTRCPSGFVGELHFDATFTNNGSQGSLSDLLVEVTTLTNGNLLQNAIGGPAGVGARLSFPDSGVALMRERSRTVRFDICLRSKDSFSFFVDVLGVVQ